VLTADELASLRFVPIGTADESITDLLELLADHPAAFYAGKSVVMVYLSENSLCRHTVTEVAVSEGKIHVTLTRSGEGAPEAEGERFVLIPVRDPEGDLWVHLAVAQTQDMLQSSVAHTSSHAHSSLGRKILGGHGANQSNDSQSAHHQAHLHNVTAVSPQNAHIHDLGNDQRNQQFKSCFQQLKQWPQDTLFSVATDVAE
jgi:hypothetical protein